VSGLLIHLCVATRLCALRCERVLITASPLSVLLFDVCAVHAQQGVVSHCRADVRDMLTNLAYVLEHAATATDTSTINTNCTTDTTADRTATAAGSAVDSMEIDAMQADTVSTSQVVSNSNDDTCHSVSQHDAGHECSAEHTAVAAVIGGSADMVLDDDREHAVFNDSSAVHTDQQQLYQAYSSSSSRDSSNNARKQLPTTPSASGTALYCLF
jgi:hypothetical protein